MEDVKWKMVNGRRQRIIVRSQRSEVRGQKSEVRGQKSEVRGQSTEVRGQKSEVRSHKSFAPLLSFLSLILIAFTTNINSQSVDSLVSEAIRNNPQLKALEHRIKASEYRVESVNNLPAPNLGIEFTQVPVEEVNVWDKAISNSLSLSQMFPIGGKVSAMTEVERKNILVTQDEYSMYKTRLIGEIKMSYYRLWMNERKIDVQRKNIDLLNNLIQSIDVLYQVNRINQADLLTIKSEIASNQTQLLILQKQSEAEVYKINKLLGRELDSKVVHTTREIPVDTFQISQTQLEERLAKVNPSLKRMNSMIDMNKAMITANNRELIPDLMVQGMIMRMPQGMLLTSKTDLTMLHEEPGKVEYMYSLMASINLPFAPWSINKYKAKEEELFSGIRAIENERTDMQREMTAQVKEQLVKLNTSKELMRLYNEDVIPLYNQALEAQVSAYQNNRTNINTVIDSYRMLLMQEMNNYMAQADYQMALAEIEMMVGETIKGFNR